MRKSAYQARAQPTCGLFLCGEEKTPVSQLSVSCLRFAGAPSFVPIPC